jgi:hypothetical protein
MSSSEARATLLRHLNAPDRRPMLGRRTTILLSLATGVALELGIHAVSGRREAWDSPLYWTIGLPIAGLAALAVGFLAQRRNWFWTVLIVPGQVLTMMLRSAEISGLLPLTVVLSAVLSAPFVVAAFVGSLLRPRRWRGN